MIQNINNAGYFFYFIYRALDTQLWSVFPLVLLFSLFLPNTSRKSSVFAGGGCLTSLFYRGIASELKWHALIYLCEDIRILSERTIALRRDLFCCATINNKLQNVGTMLKPRSINP